ncbi:unnamed protein product [Amaranthus hypochondriacus]
MRSQGCTIQQALTQEATAVVKQAVALAKKRGHVQVTPLHVAHTMLSISSGLFRAACLQSHSHPLQCRALELCFNVALNRLPTSTSGPMTGPYTNRDHQPTIANALVAGFKRAQAHQRRGSIENQQQPLLGVKIELGQLIISILDDPSVSRVMKEAGFSSTLVKEKVEQAISMETTNGNNNNNNNIKPKDSNNITINRNNNNFVQDTRLINVTMTDNNFVSRSQTIGLLKVEKPRLYADQGEVRNEDVMSVIESLVNTRKRNSVVVGECVTILESIVRGVMDRIEKGEVDDALKEVKFIHLSFSSFGHLSRGEVDQKVDELKGLVKTCCIEENKGVILYLDDLKWVNEFREFNHSNDNNINILVDQHQARRNSYYCPIEHMIMEIKKLALGYNGEFCGKVWLLGIATFQTYMRCKSGQASSLETLWGLHAITIPANSLGLSLVPNSDLKSAFICKKMDTNSSVCNSDSNNSSLPSWLQQYKDENNKRASNVNNNNQESLPIKDLCKRWGSISTSSSPSLERTLSISSISPSSSTSNFSYDPNHSMLQPTHQSFEPKNFWVTHETSNKTHDHDEPTTITMSMSSFQDLSNNDHQRSHTPSTSSSDIMDCTTKNLKLKALCYALEKQVPHQKDIIFDIASTIFQCREGLSTRKGIEQGNYNKQETWLFFQGVDIESKEKIGRELARHIFGSQDKFISLGLSSFSSTRGVIDSSLEDSRNKRLRDEESCTYIERFAKEVTKDCHRVFFVEDIEQVDYCSQMGIKKAIERGKISKHSSGEDVRFGDAIIILSCEKFRSRSRACSPSSKHIVDNIITQEDKQEMMNKEEINGDVLSTSPSISLDLNISINDDDNDDGINGIVTNHSIDEIIGLLASVDKCINFKNKHEF